MKILITGATGFIGQHLVRRLIDRGDSVSTLVRPTSQTNLIPADANILTIPEDQTQLEDMLKDAQFDGVIHLASNYLMSHSPEDISSLIEANVTFGTRVLDATARANISFFINTGSFSQHFEGKSYCPTNLYAATKQAFQDITQYYAEVSNTNILTLELFNTFGPGDTRPKIFNLWDKAIKEGRTLDMSPGEQIIDINYIDNIIDAYCIAIKHLSSANSRTFNGQTYTLTSPERMTIKELARVFAEEVKGALNINFGALPYRDRETMVPYEGTILPDWSPRISLRDGIRHTFLNKT